MKRRDERIYTAQFCDLRATIFGRRQILRGLYTVKVCQVKANPSCWQGVIVAPTSTYRWAGVEAADVQRQVEDAFNRQETEWEQWNPRTMLAIAKPVAAVTPIRRRQFSPGSKYRQKFGPA